APVFVKPDSNEVIVDPGHDAEIHFPVRMHTTVLTDCQLTKLTSDDEGSTDNFFVAKAPTVNCK
ncbi:hypothetical protein BaRGS_00024579, partial [Batillaria attramentaria]